MSPDSVFWLGRAWYTLPAICVKVRKSLTEISGDCTFPRHLVHLLPPYNHGQNTQEWQENLHEGSSSGARDALIACK